MVPPHDRPTFHAVSSATPNSSILGLPVSITSMASVTTAPSTQPPDTEPRKLPSLSITRLEPTGRGADPHVSTTVASATSRPSRRQSSAALRMSSSRASMSKSPGFPPDPPISPIYRDGREEGQWLCAAPSWGRARYERVRLPSAPCHLPRAARDYAAEGGGGSARPVLFEKRPHATRCETRARLLMPMNRRRQERHSLARHQRQCGDLVHERRAGHACRGGQRTDGVVDPRRQRGLALLRHKVFESIIPGRVRTAREPAMTSDARGPEPISI